MMTNGAVHDWLQIQNNSVTIQRVSTSHPLAWGLYQNALYRVFQKTDTQFYFWDNFGNSAPILTILSLLQAEIYGA